MAFDFTGKLETSHTPPRSAKHLGLCPITKRHRVSVLGDYAVKLPKSHPDHNWPTTFLYDNEGRCRGADGSGSEYDLKEMAAKARKAA